MKTSPIDIRIYLIGLADLINESHDATSANIQWWFNLRNLNIYYFAQHFQRNIVRGIEAFVSLSSKQMEIGEYCFPSFVWFLYNMDTWRYELNIIARKLAQDCRKYGDENQSTSSPLARASLQFGTSHISIEEERETLLGILRDQVIVHLFSLYYEYFV